MTTHALNARHEHSPGTAVEDMANATNGKIHWLVDSALNGAETVATHAGHITGKTVHIGILAIRKAVLAMLGGKER